MNLFASGQALLLQQRETPQDTRPTAEKRSVLQSRRRGNMRSQLILKTPPWLSRTVWEMAVDRAMSGWTFSIRSYSVVFYTDSPVLESCCSGDIARLQHSFDLREASPFDGIAFLVTTNTLLSVCQCPTQRK
jgi:hypothetical protein